MRESAARTRILDVASRLFYEQGYNSTGINQIIDEAMIARGSLYKHFASKRDLLSAYIQKAAESYFAELEKFLAPVKDPKQKILAFFDYRLERQLRSNFGGCEFIKISAEVPKNDLEAFELIREQKDRLKIYIRNILNQFELSKNSALTKEMLAEILFLILEGSTVTASVYKNVESIKNAKKIIKKLM
jgi:AcrR family transcriptional regulator